MKVVKLELIRDDQPELMEIHADFIRGMVQPDEDGTTFVCGACDKPILEGFSTSSMVMAGVDLVCHHCQAHNHLDTTAL